MLLAHVAIAFHVTTGTAIAADGGSPREYIQQTSDQALAILKDQSVDAATRRRRLEDLAGQRFDFETMSRLTLGRNWNQLSSAQQPEFVQEFKEHLSVTYGRNIDSYSNEVVEIVGDREEARGDWTVKTKIVRGGGNADILVDYRLRRSGDGWKIIDVTIEGVSLVANFRSQFQDIVSKGGVDRLLVLLQEKNQKGESILPPKDSGPKG